MPIKLSRKKLKRDRKLTKNKRRRRRSKQRGGSGNLNSLLATYIARIMTSLSEEEKKQIMKIQSIHEISPSERIYLVLKEVARHNLTQLGSESPIFITEPSSNLIAASLKIPFVVELENYDCIKKGSIDLDLLSNYLYHPDLYPYLSRGDDVQPIDIETNGEFMADEVRLAFEKILSSIPKPQESESLVEAASGSAVLATGNGNLRKGGYIKLRSRKNKRRPRKRSIKNQRGGNERESGARFKRVTGLIHYVLTKIKLPIRRRQIPVEDNVGHMTRWAEFDDLSAETPTDEIKRMLNESAAEAAATGAPTVPEKKSRPSKNLKVKGDDDDEGKERRVVLFVADMSNGKQYVVKLSRFKPYSGTGTNLSNLKSEYRYEAMIYKNVEALLKAKGTREGTREGTRDTIGTSNAVKCLGFGKATKRGVEGRQFIKLGKDTMGEGNALVEDYGLDEGVRGLLSFIPVKDTYGFVFEEELPGEAREPGNDCFYTVTERTDGFQTLGGYIDDNPVDNFPECMNNLFEFLQQFNNLGLIHFDLHAENLLINDKESGFTKFKMFDFDRSEIILRAEDGAIQSDSFRRYNDSKTDVYSMLKIFAMEGPTSLNANEYRKFGLMVDICKLIVPEIAFQFHNPPCIPYDIGARNGQSHDCVEFLLYALCYGMEKTRGTVYRPVGNADIARKDIFDLFNTTYSSDGSSYSDKFTDMLDTFNLIFEKVIDKRATGGSFRDDVGMKDTRPTGDDILAKLVDLVSRHVNTVVYYTRDNPTFRYYTGLGASGKDKRIDTSFDLLFPLLFMKLLVDKPGK